MKTKKWIVLTMGAILLVVAVVAGVYGSGLAAQANAAPGKAPARAIPGAEMPPLPEAACSVAGGTRICHLWAMTGTLPLADGAAASVWGFADNVAGPALVPGPVVRTLISETLEIWLHNEVPGETVALGFPGQDGLVPDLTGVPTGSAISYTLTFSQPGTFLYEAGLTEGGARQVAMGLAGPLIVEDGLPPIWDQEMVFVLGAIDPAFNLNPTGFSMIDYRPRYWLINGRSYPDTGWLATHAGNTILIRYLNASISSHAIGLLGLDQEIVAIDGSPLVLPYGIGPEAFSPGQTAEALVEVPLEAVNETGYTLYSGSLNQHNNNQRLTDMRAAFGGMLTFVKVVSGTLPSPVGPVAVDVAVTPQKTMGDVDVTLTATLADDDLDVVAAEYFTDTVGAAGTGVPVAVTPGPSVSVSVLFTVNELATWAAGEHGLYIRGQDAGGAWGAVGSAVLILDKAGPLITGMSLNPGAGNGTVDVSLLATADDRPYGYSNVVAGEYRLDGGAWQAMSLNLLDSPVTGLTALILTDTLPTVEGIYTVEVRAQDDLLNWSQVYGAIELLLDLTGPDVPAVALAPNVLDFSQPPVPPRVSLTATVSDPLSNGVQTPLVNAEGFIDVVGEPGTGFPLYPADGLFDETTEDVYYNIPSSHFAILEPGDHQVLVVGKDQAGNWGPAGSATITVIHEVVDETGPDVSSIDIQPNPTAGAREVTLTATIVDSQSNVAAAVWFVNGGTTSQMKPVDGAFDEMTEEVEATFRVNSWRPGFYTISVMGIDEHGNWGPVATIQLEVSRR